MRILKQAETFAYRLAGCDQLPFAEFMQWAIDNHRKPDINSLHQFAQQSGINTEDYGNLSRFMEGY